eukprot:TRINITY_DN2193_c4_g1_i1.p1 TRINITY_DN2193_c4_g1~~TRINITY_DN2193_c4_g1_i1.p1  ORF type:complete len:444 (-),score=64.92 TRINITY_DN2193_c4_g1_i1:154-1485(-)
MDVEAMKSIPTPLSPSKRDRLVAMGSIIAGDPKALPAKNMTDCAAASLSEGLINGSGSGQEEFNRILLMRRSKVDGEGTTWESPAGRQSVNSDRDDACFAGRLAHCGSAPVPSTPEHGPAPWPSSGRPRAEAFHADIDPLRSPGSSTEGGLPSTPPRKKTAAAPKLTDEQKASIALHLTPEQLDMISGAFSSSQSGPSEDDESKSQASSGNDTGSSHSPKGGVPRRRRGSASCPPPKPGSLYDEVPKYPELRKRRSTGTRVRFADDRGEKMDSDDDKIAAPTPGNICLKTRGRRVSRGPDGAPYKVDMDGDDDDDNDDDDDDESGDAEPRAPSASGLSVGTYATAVARGATGAFCGGATGAAVGLGGALFTFGLSVPICALVGSTYGGFYGVSSALPEGDRPRQGTSSTHVAGNSQHRGGGSARPTQEGAPSETSRRRRHSRQ